MTRDNRDRDHDATPGNDTPDGVGPGVGPDGAAGDHWSGAAACDMSDGCGAAAGQPCEPGCPSLAMDPDGSTFEDFRAAWGWK